jgi:hypothetical protein
VKGQASTVVRWPLYSWRNLSVTVVAVLFVLYGMGHVIGPAKITLPRVHVPLVTATQESSASSLSTPALAAPSPGPAAAPSTAQPTSAVSGAPAGESVTRLATAFAQAWTSSSRSQQQWTHGIQPFVTPVLAAGLAQTDPARVPATKVTGEAVLLTALATSAQVRVPTDGGSIVVTLEQVSGSWLVSDVAPAGQPPAAPTPDLRPPTSPAGS